MAVLLPVLGMTGARAAEFQIVYDTPEGEAEKNARAFLQEEGVTRTVSTLINNEFQLRSGLTLYMGGKGGPTFDRAGNEVRMPYGFVFDIADRFYRDSYSNTSANVYDVTRDAYLHALLHQVSHALFTMYDLRTSGSTEKAVDALAVLLLLRYYDGGGEVVLNAAELFVDEGGEASTGGGTGFWAEHRFDRQSYHQAICLVYGSDPERYASLADASEFLQIRGRECIREFERQNNAWFRVLRSFLKRPPPD